MKKLFVSAIALVFFSIIPAAASAQAPQVTGVTHNFSATSDPMVVGSTKWTLYVYGLQYRDTVYVEAWKDGASLGKFRICTPTLNSGQCSETGVPRRADIGSWEESLIVRRNGVDTTVAPRGAIKFRVIAAPTTSRTPTSRTSGSTSTRPQNPRASLSISPSRVIAGQNVTYNWSSTNATSWAWSIIITRVSDGARVNSDGCGTIAGNWTGPAGGNSASGSWTGRTDDCQAGYTYYIYYKAMNGTRSAQAQKIITVVAPATTSQKTDGDNSFANAIKAMMETLKDIFK